MGLNKDNYSALICGEYDSKVEPISIHNKNKNFHRGGLFRESGKVQRFPSHNYGDYIGLTVEVKETRTDEIKTIIKDLSDILVKHSIGFKYKSSELLTESKDKGIVGITFKSIPFEDFGKLRDAVAEITENRDKGPKK